MYSTSIPQHGADRAHKCTGRLVLSLKTELVARVGKKNRYGLVALRALTGTVRGLRAGRLLRYLTSNLLRVPSLDFVFCTCTTYQCLHLH